MDGKGRNRELIERRNAQIVSRYYYWTEVQRLRFDDAVRQLSENEFFLSESRIIQILKNAQIGTKIKISAPRCPKLTEEQIRFFKNSEE